MKTETLEGEPRIYLSDKDSLFRVKTLFVLPKSLLRLHRYSWLKEDNNKISTYLVLFAIHLELLRTRLDSDLELPHYGLRKDFNWFLARTIKLSDAFQLVNKSASSRQEKNHKGRRGNDREDLEMAKVGVRSPPTLT